MSTEEKYVDDTINTHKVVVWSKSYCPYCNKTKDLFKSLNVDIHVVELDQVDNGDKYQAILKTKTGQSSVPSVWINKQHIGGNDDTQAKHKDGSLQKLLGNDKFKMDDEAKEHQEDENEEEKAVDSIVSTMLLPFAGKFSFGSILGFSAGYAAKKVGKAAALGVGMVFLGLQLMAYNGYININWGKVEKAAVEKLDQDGDGDFDADDVKILAKRIFRGIRYQAPGGAGFGLCFFLGFKKG